MINGNRLDILQLQCCDDFSIYIHYVGSTYTFVYPITLSSMYVNGFFFCRNQEHRLSVNRKLAEKNLIRFFP